MHIVPPQTAELTLPAPNSPTDKQRHEMLYNSLAEDGRIEDYDNIISLLSPPPNITRYAMPGEFKNIKVGIIGGGLAGMAAAFELRKLGYDITIFEPNTERIGGRVYTYYFDKDKRLYGELGARRIPVSHETSWHYINLFGLNTVPFINEDSNTFTYVRSTRVRNDLKGENIFYQIYPRFSLGIQEKNIPWPALYRNANRYYLSTLPPDIRKQFLMIMPRYDFRFEALEGLSLRDAMVQYGLSSEAVNLIANVVPMLGGLTYHSYEKTLNEEYSLDFLNLYRIPGGMVNLPLAFHKSLTSPNPAEYPGIPQHLLGKVNWRGGLIVTGIHESDTDAKVALSYRSPLGSRDYFDNFDYVICAVPLSSKRMMALTPDFSVPKMQAMREVMYEDAFKALILCKERFWERQGIFAASSLTDSVIETIEYPQDHAHFVQNPVNCLTNEPGVFGVNNTNQDALRLGNEVPQTQYQIIAREVEEVHGLPKGYLDNLIMSVKTIDWIKEPWFHGAFQVFLPGQKKNYLYAASIPEYNNRLFFAGEHASTKNAWIQGALQSGMKAANDLVYYSIIHKYQK